MNPPMLSCSPLTSGITSPLPSPWGTMQKEREEIRDALEQKHMGAPTLMIEESVAKVVSEQSMAIEALLKYPTGSLASIPTLRFLADLASAPSATVEAFCKIVKQ